MKKIYLIRHSSSFVSINNYGDYKNVSWNDYNRNMILSVEGERNAEKLCEVEELKGVDVVYSGDSFRAIGTAKYISELNNLSLNLNDRINERNLGVSKISELSSNFNSNSFKDKDYKYMNGESLNEVDCRFQSFINEILDSDYTRIVIVFHGIILLSYLQKICDYFSFDENLFFIKYKDNMVLNGKLKNLDVFKLTFDDYENIISVSRI